MSKNRKFSWRSVLIPWTGAAVLTQLALVLFAWDRLSWWHFTILPAVQLILIAMAERAYPTKVKE